MPKPIVVEVCVDTPDGAAIAARAGAHRIELCADLGCGGVTPSAGLLGITLERVEVPLVALIRPRPGHFVYTPAELRAMHADVALARRAGAGGVAVGCLDERGELATEPMKRLIDAAGDMPVVCHRAFDACRSPEQALDTLCELGIRRVLTSGGAPSAADGAAIIARLVQRAGGAIDVLAGAGIRSDNVAALVEATGCREVHASASGERTVPTRGPAMGREDRPGTERFTDEAEVRALVAAVEEL